MQGELRVSLCAPTAFHAIRCQAVAITVQEVYARKRGRTSAFDRHDDATPKH